MKIERIVVGSLEENCYIIEKNGQAIIIDPGDEFDVIQKKIGDAKLLKVLITHNHFDHIGALSKVMNTYQVDKMSFENLEEKEYKVGPFTFQVLFTKGHSSDSVSYYFEKEKVMFVGDFVFSGTIGRCDLPTGDFQEMKESIRKLCTYPKETILYPGHGEETTIEKEQKENPYF